MSRLDFTFIRKKMSLEKFRKNYLKLTPKKYTLRKQLACCSNLFDLIVVGSDQVWNAWFTLQGERKTTLSYFLDFADEHVKRVGYAVSFGFHTPSEEYVCATKDEVKQFSSISAREADGVDIMSAFGVVSKVVCDPTVLLTKQDYMKLIDSCDKRGQVDVFSYILERETDAWKTVEYVGEKLMTRTSRKPFSGTMQEWLSSINHAKMVVTDSFHGTMLAIILNTPFIALPRKNAGMNSRIPSLLARLGLSSRMVDHFSENGIDPLIDEPIDWEDINKKLELFRAEGIEYLKQSIQE